MFEVIFYIGFCLVIVGALLVLYYQISRLKIEPHDFIVLAGGVFVLVIGIGGGYSVNNTQKETVLEDAKEIFGEEVELVQIEPPFSNINIEFDGVRYRTYKENGEIFYEEISIVVDEEEYGDRVVRKRE